MKLNSLQHPLPSHFIPRPPYHFCFGADLVLQVTELPPSAPAHVRLPVMTMLRTRRKDPIRGSHSGARGQYYLLGYNAVSPLKVNRRFGGTMHFTELMDHERSLPCSQEPAIVSIPEAVESNPYFQKFHVYDPF
jgi:hypothetical protein